MPTYEFRCPQGHEFEKFYRSISGAEAQAACPVCNQLADRMMSATSFAFKGSGFYLTDYGKNAHREKGTPGAAGAPSGGEGAASESAKTDSAPAVAKSESAAKSAASAGTSETKKPGPPETKKAAAAPEAKPPAAAPKKSSGE